MRNSVVFGSLICLLTACDDSSMNGSSNDMAKPVPLPQAEIPGLTFTRIENPTPFAIPPQDVTVCDHGGSGNYQYTTSLLGDLNRDGRAEVVMTYYGSVDFSTPIDRRVYDIDLAATTPRLTPRELALPIEEGIAWIGDLDQDGRTDLIGSHRPYYGTAAGAFEPGEPWPNGQQVDHRVIVDNGMLSKGTQTISTHRREDCADNAHQMRVFKQTSPRRYEEANEILPSTVDGVQIQSLATAQFPRYEAFGFIGFDCPSGPPVRNIFMRKPGESEWKLDEVAYQGCGSAMGVLFEPEALYITCFPQVYRYGLNADDTWTKTPNPFEIDRDLYGNDLIPWGIKRVHVKGHDIYLVAHGQDDSCRREFRDSVLSTITAYTEYEGRNIRIDLGDLTRDLANWRWCDVTTVDGRVVITCGTIGNDPKGRSIGQGTPQVYIAPP